MSDKKSVTVNPKIPAVYGLVQLLSVLVNPSSRKQIEKLLNFRNLLTVVLSGLFWKLDATFDFRTRLRRVFEGRAVIRSTDDSYAWIMHHLTTHPNFLASQRDIEVTTKAPTAQTKGKSSSLPIIEAKKGIYIESCGKKMTLDKVDDSKQESEEVECQDEAEDTVSVPPKEVREEVEQPKPSEAKVDKGKEAGKPNTPAKAATKDAIQVILKPAPSTTMYFVFQKTHFWATQELVERKDGRMPREEIILHYWSFSSSIVKQFIIQAHKNYMADQEKRVKKVSMYRLNPDGRWKGPTYAKRRPFDTVHLPGATKQAICQDARTFFSPGGQRKYANRTIPYRRGLLFYGPPGNGKTTLVHCLATDLCEPLYVLDLGSPTLDDEIFLHAMKELPARCIVLIEDIDVAFIKRDEQPAALSKSRKEDDRKDINDKKKNKKESGISFSALLNALDGLMAAEGRLLCVTTNHYHQIDPALIRPGRIDRKFEILNATPDQARQLFLRWFTLKNKEPTDEVKQHADMFAQAIPDGKLSVAAIQGYLLGYDDDSEQAALCVEAWVKEESRQSKVA